MSELRYLGNHLDAASGFATLNGVIPSRKPSALIEKPTASGGIQ